MCCVLHSAIARIDGSRLDGKTVERTVLQLSLALTRTFAAPSSNVIRQGPFHPSKEFNHRGAYNLLRLWFPSMKAKEEKHWNITETDKLNNASSNRS
ncbi:uncharacterized protein LOC114936085 isoform X2 [Nylanderia fulva]|uniref:uncharacterized protein LOC114936085 isoform X2 n=1 Tax=Nylanderia fulva TaxID=613905 RepID=UPI0010FAEFA7|nr:uncharacterized protein LOC114936085 isoform X2 [Nylanderia fulva]XP_029164940.1 uncharacterized protein LOC114936085 isoform X2 [Nylanderia fulva]